MDFDILSKMNVDELKSFLRLRGLKPSGWKEELVARAFVAIENKLPTVHFAEEVEAVIIMIIWQQKKFHILSSLLRDG